MADNPILRRVLAKELDALDLERGLTPREVAELLTVHVVTLQQWRARGEGPRYVKYGASPRSPIRYRLRDVLAWRDARTVGREP